MDLQTTNIYQTIKTILQTARDNAYRQVNFIMVEAYWNIGKQIVEEEQQGEDRAKYGSYMIKELSKQSLWNMRQFYNSFPILSEVRRELTPKDIIKDPYILEFLDLQENKLFHESELESALIEKIQAFLLELGRGFAFVDRQKRIKTEHSDFYIDLVFYTQEELKAEIEKDILELELKRENNV